MSNPTLLKNYTAGGAINAFRLVKFSAAETVVLAAAATDAIMGVCNEVAPASGERCDIIHEGIAFVEAGASFAQGAAITSDASGRGISTVTIGNRAIGFAIEAAAAAGDVVRVLVNPFIV
jgi:hypothetical protein